MRKAQEGSSTRNGKRLPILHMPMIIKKKKEFDVEQSANLLFLLQPKEFQRP